MRALPTVIVSLLFVSLAVVASGCHFFEDPDDEILLNSRYPYPCIYDPEDPFNCDDGSRCLPTNSADEYGFCSHPCEPENGENGEPENDENKCDNTDKNGTGECNLFLEYEGEKYFFCSVICIPGSKEFSCPSGLQCDPNLMACVAELLETSY